MTISLIAAVASNGVIGLNGGIPWSIPEDMAYFKTITMGHRVIMGRNTFKSIGKPLKDRQNVIVSTELIPHCFAAMGAIIMMSPEEAISLPQWGEHEEVFCIGGAKLYEAMLPLAGKMYLTEIREEFSGDTYFPEWDRSEWYRISSRQTMSINIPFIYAFNVYERKSNY